jgi:hypothetical protein
MSHRGLQLTVVLDPSAEPIAGTVEPVGGPPRPFVGWVDLAAALDELLEGRKAVGQAAGRRGRAGPGARRSAT